MKIEIEMVDGFLLSREGQTRPARVAHVRWQRGPRQAWKSANIIVDEETPSRVVEAVSIYLREQSL